MIKVKVAVSVNEAGEIIPHLGKSKIFHVFFKHENQVEFVENRVTDGNHQNHIIEDIKDCETVISGKIGEGMIESLQEMGIEAVVETEIVDPIEAVKKL